MLALVGQVLDEVPSGHGNVIEELEAVTLVMTGGTGITGTPRGLRCPANT